MTEQLEVRMAATVPAARVRPRRRLVVVLLLAVTLGAGLWFLTPSSLGGRADYLVTRGTSMLPTHEPGALIVTRTRGEYAVSDVIAFHSERRGRIVLHRIVGTDGDRFVTRGDNNDFDDAFHPAVSDIVGTPWLHVPHGADAIARLRAPVVPLVVIGALVLLALATARQRRRPTPDRLPGSSPELTR